MRLRSLLLHIVTFSALLCACGGKSRTATGVDPGTPSAYPVAAQKCIDTINQYRATLGLPAYAEWTDAESCSDAAAKHDADTGEIHGAFRSCGESAQNECPGWSGAPDQMIEGCLAMMWGEGPGSDFSTHGHYINMSDASYTKVACGFFVTSGDSVWSVQNFR